MILEHIAINVPDAIAMADWYVEHCGLRMVIKLNDAPFTRFLTDQKGRTCIEIYSNRDIPMPDYSQIHHQNYHQAFAVKDPEATSKRLQEAGATFVEDMTHVDGTRLIMLRDPWQVPLQIVQRAKPWY